MFGGGGRHSAADAAAAGIEPSAAHHHHHHQRQRQRRQLGSDSSGSDSGISSAGASANNHNYFEFVTLSDAYKADTPDWQDLKKGTTAENDPGNANVPGYRVRKQTRSIAAVLKMAQGRAKYVLPTAMRCDAMRTFLCILHVVCPASCGLPFIIFTNSVLLHFHLQPCRYYMFLEDDMVLCPHGFNSIHYLLSKATKYSPDWLAIRASYGMNGIFIHNKDIDHFYHYLVVNQKRRPPDHLAGMSCASGCVKGCCCLACALCPVPSLTPLFLSLSPSPSPSSGVVRGGEEGICHAQSGTGAYGLSVQHFRPHRNLKVAPHCIACALLCDAACIYASIINSNLPALVPHPPSICPSTLRKAKQTSFPRCYEFLGVPTLFEVEAFDPRACPADDIWPCKARSRRDLESDRAIVQWMHATKH